MSSIFISNTEDHSFTLDQYEGPLDLLLAMIKEAKIDIKDIFVSKITDQYIEYIRNMEIMDIEKASDFVAMAATLLEIKSAELLPKIEMLEEEDNYQDDMLYLKRQLEIYNLFQEVSQRLQLNETKYRFYREPEYSEDDCKHVFVGSTYDKLIDAYAGIIHRMEFKEREKEPKNIEKDIYTVEEKILYLNQLIKRERKIKFFELFVNDNSTSAVLNTFLALLELLKRQSISAVQEKDFSDILIIEKEGEEEIDGQFKEYN